MAQTTTVLGCSGPKSGLTDNTHLRPPESAPPPLKEWNDEWWKVGASAAAITDDGDLELEPLDEGHSLGDKIQLVDAYLISMSIDDSEMCVLADLELGTWVKVGEAYPYPKVASNEKPMAG